MPENLTAELLWESASQVANSLRSLPGWDSQ